VASSPLDHFDHDHRVLSELLIAVREALGRVERDPTKLSDELHEIRDGIEAFREAVLEHFAREQENLLPFVTSALPSMGDRCDALVADHDRIAALLTALVRDLGTAEASGTMATWTPLFTTMESVYATHSRVELAFFEEVGASLATDADAARRLRELIDAA
jgi:hypothetical protein